MFTSSISGQNHRSIVPMPKQFQLYPEHLRAANYYCTNNSKTDYNFSGGPKSWSESSAKASYDNRQSNQPFFAVYNLTTSHESQVAPKNGKTDFRIAADKIVLPPYHPDTTVIRRDWANYYDQMTLMDQQVGELLAKLDRDGLANRRLPLQPFRQCSKPVTLTNPWPHSIRSTFFDQKASFDSRLHKKS